jgi:predicted Zn-dependent peptidase
MVGYSWALTGDGILAERYLDLISAVTAEEARAAIQRMLTEAGSAGHNRVVILPKA